MENRIENLGDYNRVRIDLQAKGGDLNALYDEIRDTAVSEATPKLMLQGGAIGILVCGAAVLIPKAVRFVKRRKEKIKKEPVLKEQFIKRLQNDSATQDDEDFQEDEEIK